MWPFHTERYSAEVDNVHVRWTMLDFCLDDLLDRVAVMQTCECVLQPACVKRLGFQHKCS